MRGWEWASQQYRVGVLSNHVVDEILLTAWSYSRPFGKAGKLALDARHDEVHANCGDVSAMTPVHDIDAGSKKALNLGSHPQCEPD